MAESNEFRATLSTGQQIVLYQTAEIIIVGSELGTGLDNNELRKVAKRFALDTLQGKSFVNLDTGKTISISRAGINKTIANTADIRRVKLLPGLPALLINATHFLTEPAAGKDPTIKAFHRFIARVNLENQSLDVGILVREDVNGNWFYNQDFIK